jgi:hypothetical protein
VAEHNGQIRVEDNPPAGARFTVEIPAMLEMDSGEGMPAGGAKTAAGTASPTAPAGPAASAVATREALSDQPSTVSQPGAAERCSLTAISLAPKTSRMIPSEPV